MQENEQILTAYLLGELALADVEELEASFCRDEVLFERMLGRRDELIEEYSAGWLSPSQRRYFERHFISSPELRWRVEMTRVLLALFDAERSAQVPFGLHAASQPPSWLERLRRKMNLSGMVGVFTVVALALCAGGLPFVFISLCFRPAH